MDSDLHFGSQELEEVFKDNNKFAKFDINKAHKIEVVSSKVQPREANFDGKTTQRYDIEIKIDGEEESKIWSVSKTVLSTIANNWDNTKKFNVMRQEKSYSVIPLLE